MIANARTKRNRISFFLFGVLFILFGSCSVAVIAVVDIDSIIGWLWIDGTAEEQHVNHVHVAITRRQMTLSGRRIRRQLSAAEAAADSLRFANGTGPGTETRAYLKPVTEVTYRSADPYRLVFFIRSGGMKAGSDGCSDLHSVQVGWRLNCGSQRATPTLRRFGRHLATFPTWP